ncbi:MAG: threonine ammonia-lyase, partial [Hyphomicrobiales bacterium]
GYLLYSLCGAHMGLTPELIERAAGAISPAFLNTPVAHSEGLDGVLGVQAYLKVETLTPIRSFKGRGADYLVQCMKDVAPNGVVCASAGNFGQGIAWAGRAHGVPVTVFAATNANPLKLDAMRGFGAVVVTVGSDLDEAKAAADAHAKETGKKFLIDGMHDEGAAGAGTMALELTRDHAPFDVVLVPIGNGALVNGIGTWMKAHSPETQVIAVAASGAPCMEMSWRENALVETQSVDTIADGLAVRVPVAEALAHMRKTTDDFLLVSDETMQKSVRLLFDHVGLMVEPSGAIGIGAMIEHVEKFEKKRVATVLCGGNVTREQAQEWLF